MRVASIINAAALSRCDDDRRHNAMQVFAAKEVNVKALKKEEREHALNEIRLLASMQHPVRAVANRVWYGCVDRPVREITEANVINPQHMTPQQRAAFEEEFKTDDGFDLPNRDKKKKRAAKRAASSTATQITTYYLDDEIVELHHLCYTRAG